MGQQRPKIRQLRPNTDSNVQNWIVTSLNAQKQLEMDQSVHTTWSFPAIQIYQLWIKYEDLLT